MLPQKIGPGYFSKDIEEFLDLLNQIDGVSFEEAWTNRIELTFSLPEMTCHLCYIGIKELRKNKLASGRPKDLQDIEYLDP